MTQTLRTPSIEEHLAERRLLAVVTLADTTLAVPLARALLAGGIDTIELTLRTPVALDCIRAIKSECSEMRVGAGTVLNPDQADQALQSGADYAVSPSVNREVLRHAHSIGLSFYPGVMTPTDIDISLQEGCHLLKFFPATSSGGLEHLRNIAAPFTHLGIGFIPLGGINLDHLTNWLADPLVTAVGGSWLAPKDLIDTHQWEQIKLRAAMATAKITTLPPAKN